METTSTYRFSLEDRGWQTYLENNGYVVVKAVVGPEEVERARDLFWNHFEENNGVKRDDLDSWQNWTTDRRGIITNASVIQCAGAWYVRGLPQVKAVFQEIWQTSDLIVSMDSLLLWKPWRLNPRWMPITEGLHTDQNPFQKPDRVCVQGMVALYDVTEDTGGLEVVPKSHLPEAQEILRQTLPDLDGRGDFCMIRANNKKLVTERKLLLAEAGDIILWDSRTIHGGLVGKGGYTTRENPTLPRMSLAVCMLPRSTASDEVLRIRQKGFKEGNGFSHWANEAHITSEARPGYKPIELTPEQLALL